jgi:HK97 family phage portal protein
MFTWPFIRPKEAKQAPAPLLAWHAPARAVWPQRSAHAFIQEGYARNAVAYRCVRMIAECAASAPLRVTPHDHPLSALLARPNPEQTGTELREAFFGHLQVAGNAYIEAISLGDDPPRELHALRPDRVHVIPGPRGWPSGFEYRAGPYVRRIERDPLSEWCAVLHFKLFHPGDDWYGLSPLEAAWTALAIHNEGAAWSKALLDNAARPSGALVYTGAGGSDRLSEDQFERLKGELENTYTGARNAGRPLLLEGGLDWKAMSLSPAEMDFLEARHAAAREIALAFGVPPMLLGLPGDNTYANFKEANLAFWRGTVLPLADKAARALTLWLGGMWADAGPATVSIDLDAIPALSAEREALWARVAGADFLTTDEKRRLVGCEEASAP